MKSKNLRSPMSGRTDISTVSSSTLGEKVEELLVELGLEDDELSCNLQNHNIRDFFEDTQRVSDVWRRTTPRGLPQDEAKEVGDARLWSSRFNDVDLKVLLKSHPAYFRDFSPHEARGPEKPPRNSIVLLLESPHVEEYCYCKCTNEITPVGPAQGATGRAIKKLQQSLLALSIKLPFLVCNPVPWQSSLAFFHNFALDSKEGKSIRDSVWNCLWKSEQEDFPKRLRSYYPAVVINACTGGKKLNGLRSTLGAALTEWEPRLVTSCHPSCPSFSSEENLRSLSEAIRNKILAKAE